MSELKWFYVCYSCTIKGNFSIGFKALSLPKEAYFNIGKAVEYIQDNFNDKNVVIINVMEMHENGNLLHQ